MTSIKQKKALKLAVENGGNISKAMREAGYSPQTAKNPKKLTESKAWQDLMSEYLDDEELARVHKEGLNAVKKEHKIVDRDESGSPIYDFVNVDDYATRHKYLETAYKLKGYFAPEKIDHTSKGERIEGFNYIVPNGDTDNPTAS